MIKNHKNRTSILLFDGATVLITVTIVVGLLLGLLLGKHVTDFEGSLWSIERKEIVRLDVAADNEFSVSGVGRQGFHQNADKEIFSYTRNKKIYVFDADKEQEVELFSPELLNENEDVLLFGWSKDGSKVGIALWDDEPDDGGRGGVDPPPTKRFVVHDLLSNESVILNPDGVVWGWIDDNILLVSKLRFSGSSSYTDYYFHNVETDTAHAIGERDRELLSLAIDPIDNSVSILEVLGDNNVLSEARSIETFSFEEIVALPFAVMQNIKPYKKKMAFVKLDDPTDLLGSQKLIIANKEKYSCVTSLRYQWVTSRKVLIKCGDNMELIRI